MAGAAWCVVYDVGHWLECMMSIVMSGCCWRGWDLQQSSGMEAGPVGTGCKDRSAVLCCKEDMMHVTRRSEAAVGRVVCNGRNYMVHPQGVHLDGACPHSTTDLWLSEDMRLAPCDCASRKAA